MLITKILKSRRDRNRFDVYVDEKPAFLVSESVLAKTGLYTGKRISESEVEHIVLEDARERAHQIAINFISYRPRSSKEVADKLARKGFQQELAQQEVDRLRELKLINDLEFARIYVRDKLRGKPMGRAMLRRKLLEKGISFQATERVLKEYITDENEQEAAKVLATRKLKVSHSRLSALEPSVRLKRLVDYLLNRGFSSEIAFKTARNVTR